MKLVSVLSISFAFSSLAGATTPAVTPAPPAKEVAPVAACAPAKQLFDAAMLTDTANLLAGYDVAGPLAALGNSTGVKSHRDSFQASWAKLDARQLDKVKSFANNEIVPRSGAGPLFYPFSGPDFLYASALFPNASSYFLTGLEPVGAVPNLSAMSAAELNASLAGLRKSLYAVLNFSFFKTNDMRVDFRRDKFQGVVPVLLTFAVKSGFQGHSVQFFTVDKNGVRCNTDAQNLVKVSPGTITGVDLGLKNSSRSTSLTYISADIGDNGMARTPQYANLVRSLKPSAAFLKSASFLLHKSYFSNIRNLLMEQSPIILQDDSGIPYRDYAKAGWKETFYGTYVRPIPLFANFLQNDLTAAFKAKGSTPLEFGIGYRYGKKDSSLLLMQKP
jgi:hypothetical protein